MYRYVPFTTCKITAAFIRVFQCCQLKQYLILVCYDFDSLVLKILMTAPCGVCVTSCVRTGLAPTAAAVARATSWSSTDTAELTSPVSVSFTRLFEQFVLHTVCSDFERVNEGHSHTALSFLAASVLSVCASFWCIAAY